MGGGKWPPRVRKEDAEGEGGVEPSWEMVPLSPTGSDSEHSDTERSEDEETKQLKVVDTEQSEEKDTERPEHGLQVPDSVEISADVCALCASVVADVDSSLADVEYPHADVESPPADVDSFTADVNSPPVDVNPPPADIDSLAADVDSPPADVERSDVPETTSDDGHQTAELMAELTADGQQQVAEETAGEEQVAVPVDCPVVVNASHAANEGGEGGDGSEGISSEGGKDDKSEGREVRQEEQEKAKSVLLLVEADLSSAPASATASSNDQNQTKLARRLADALLHAAGATSSSLAGTDAPPLDATSPARLLLRRALGEGSLDKLPAWGELSSSLLVVPFAPGATDSLMADILASGLEVLPVATADVDNPKASSQSDVPVPPVHVSAAVLVLSATDLNALRLLLCEGEGKKNEGEEEEQNLTAASAAALLKKLQGQFDLLRVCFRYAQGVPIALLDTHSLSPDTLAHCHSFLLSSLHLPSSWPIFSIPALLKPPGELDSPAPVATPESEDSPEKSPEESSDSSNSNTELELACALCPASVGALLVSVMHLSSLSLELNQLGKKNQAGASGGADTAKSTQSTQSEDTNKWAALWHAADSLTSGRLSHTLTTVTPHLNHLHQMYLPLRPHLHQVTLHLDSRFPSLRPQIVSLYRNPRKLVLPLSPLLLALLLLSFLLSGLVFFVLRSWVYHGGPLPFPLDILLSPVFDAVAAVCGCNAAAGGDAAAGAAGAAGAAAFSGGCGAGPYFGPFNNEYRGGWGSWWGYWPSSPHHHRQHYYYRTRWAPAR